MVDLLQKKEKRILGFMTIVLFGSVIFFGLIALGEKRAYFKDVEMLSSKKREYLGLRLKTLEKRSEYLKWRQTYRDVEDLREEYFYDGKEGIKKLRIDLQRIFNSSEVRPSGGIAYDYYDLNLKNFKKVVVRFNLVGSYYSLKKFINTIISFPRFLVIEKIDFLEARSDDGKIEVMVILAGYYES